jgi:hypothetical protein
LDGFKEEHWKNTYGKQMWKHIAEGKMRLMTTYKLMNCQLWSRFHQASKIRDLHAAP